MSNKVKSEEKIERSTIQFTKVTFDGDGIGNTFAVD